MMIVESGVYAQEGIGKPDYKKEVSSGRERPGLVLKYNQTLKSFGRVFTDLYAGTHTAAVHATIMTDAAAHFTVNALLGGTIVNVTDGSFGLIIANGVTTVTVVALIGGATNQWNTGDAYNIPSPFATVTTPLAAGATAHFIDSETGFEMPYTVPVGYTLTAIQGGSTFSQDARIWLYHEGWLSACVGVPFAGSSMYIAHIIGWGTALFDPGGLAPHPFDFQMSNEGGADLHGGTFLHAVLEAVGTEPLPTTKTVRCKFCGHEESVSRETTRWICTECGQLNIYYNLTSFRGS